MLRANPNNIIDLVVSTINVISPGDSLAIAGNGLFKNDVVIDGDLTVYGTINGTGIGGGGTSGTPLAINVESVPSLPNVTAINVQDAINQLSSLSHTQNTDTTLDSGGVNQITASELNQHIKQYLEISDTSGGLVIPTIDVDIPFDTHLHINTHYTHTIGSPIIIFNVSGTYKIVYKATTEITNGFTRTNTEFGLQIDTGGGFVDIPNTKSNVTNRTTGGGPSTIHSTHYITVNAGDDIKLIAQKTVGTSTVTTVAGKTTMVINKMD